MSLEATRRRKERTYPELTARGGRAWLRAWCWGGWLVVDRDAVIPGLAPLYVSVEEGRNAEQFQGKRKRTRVGGHPKSLYIKSNLWRKPWCWRKFDNLKMSSLQVVLCIASKLSKTSKNTSRCENAWGSLCEVHSKKQEENFRETGQGQGLNMLPKTKEEKHEKENAARTVREGTLPKRQRRVATRTAEAVHSTLYSPREESFPIQLKYSDVSWTTHWNLDVKQERRIDDYWNVEGSRDLSDYWTGFTQFTLLEEKPADGKMLSGRRLTRKQLTSRPEGQSIYGQNSGR